MPQTVIDFPDAWKQGLYEAIFRRRDIRKFRPDPVSDSVLAKILCAAHHAGSVGFMQPWNFVLVQDMALRNRLWEHVEAERVIAAEHYVGTQRDRYLSYKLEGIREAPINLCVTCDVSRNGPHVLGRNTIRQTDLFSVCCAIQNLWLAARAEGLGVGWVSILEPAFLKELLQLPEPVHPVAYLCIGHPLEFPEKPMLETTGWQARAKLDELVFLDGWDGPPADGLTGELRKNR